jgi:hypothetical protein
MLVGVALPTAPTVWWFAVAAALATAGCCWKAWPWIVRKSGIDSLVSAVLDDPDDERWRDDGSGERAGWDAQHLRGLSPHNAWIAAPDERGFVADSSVTAEIPAVKATVDTPTVIYDTGLFDLRLRRPKGKRRAGVR